MNDRERTTISFEGESAGVARKAASEWLGDFTKHGPLTLHSIRVSMQDGKYLAVVTYSE